MSERSERDSIRGVRIRAGAVRIYIYIRPGGTGPVGQVLAGPTFQMGDSEITIITDSFKGEFYN